MARHLNTLRSRRPIAPLVVCNAGADTWYIHDGNHRYYALSQFFPENDQAHVGVALAVPKVGFQFVYRWFVTYGTYILEPAAPPLSERAFRGRTLVLIAHRVMRPYVLDCCSDYPILFCCLPRMAHQLTPTSGDALERERIMLPCAEPRRKRPRQSSERHPWKF